ncbi:MAG TPA: MBL fold metallo-hydrolase [Streptosporangiaceae bacterium]
MSAEPVTVTFAGSGDAFGSGGRFQACIQLSHPDLTGPVLLDCGATSMTALRQAGLDPGEIRTVFLSHLHGDHFGGLPFLILDGQFSRRENPLQIIGPPGTQERLSEAMECLFPGSTQVRREFLVLVTDLSPGQQLDLPGMRVVARPARHPSGASALILRLELCGKVIAYTGDTSWTDAIPLAAAGADLLIIEAYYRHKRVPHHLRLEDLTEHRSEIKARRIIVTHMSADMLAHPTEEHAHDGMVVYV